MTAALEQYQLDGRTCEAPPPPAGVTNFVQDLVKDVKQAKGEVQSDQAAMVQDKNDGIIVRGLIDQKHHHKLHVKNEALFDSTVQSVLNDAHRDLALEPQYIRDTQKRADTETAVLKEVCSLYGVKLPDLSISPDNSGRGDAPTASVGADRQNAQSELQGDIQAVGMDKSDLRAMNTISREASASYISWLPGMQEMQAALSKDGANSLQDIKNENLYRVTAESRVGADMSNFK